MTRRAVLLVALVLAGCGDGSGGEKAPRAADDAGLPAPAAADPGTPAAAAEGRQLVLQSGCLACHRFGRAGNDGPGPELSSIGERLPREAIARALVEAPQPMPSYADLPAADRQALVDYLVTLRGPDRSTRIQGRNERDPPP